MKFATKPNDRIIGCLVESHDIADKIPEIREKFNKFLSDNKLEGEFVGLQLHNNAKIPDEIIRYVNQNEKHFVDFIVVLKFSFLLF